MRAKFLATVALALLSGSAASASSVSAGMVTGFATRGNNVVLVYIEGTRSSGIPACSSSASAGRWAFDPTASMGTAWLDLLTTAKSRNERVSVSGHGGCELAGDTESVGALGTGEAGEAGAKLDASTEQKRASDAATARALRPASSN